MITRRNNSDMKLYTHDEILEDTFGAKGTPKRDKFEKDIEAYLSHW